MRVREGSVVRGAPRRGPGLKAGVPVPPGRFNRGRDVPRREPFRRLASSAPRPGGPPCWPEAGPVLPVGAPSRPRDGAGLAVGVPLFLLVLAALGGCASGSGSGAAPRPPLAPPPPVECIPTHAGECLPAAEFQATADDLAEQYRRDPNFDNQWGLDAIGAHRAYGHVNLLQGPDAAPGAGVTVGVIDSGIDAEHPIFAGKEIYQGFLFSAVPETGERFSHGTAVASIAAGAKTEDPGAPHGVAWGADLAVWAIPLGEADQVYEPISLETLARADRGFTYMFEQVFAWRDAGGALDILNLSFGYDGLIDGYSEADLRVNFGDTIATLAQADAPDKTILVWAAGNANNDECEAGIANCVNGVVNAASPGVLPGLLARIEELQGHSIAVVALSPDGAITDFSNRCGIAAGFCIAAPGEEVALAYFGPDREGFVIQGYARGRGTSYAAPMVSGGLAVMKQLFRDQLSNEELVSRLFLTADRSGFYGDRDVYGNGRMDLGAATSPVGVLEVPLATGTATAAHAGLGSTGLRLGAAFGDGFSEVLGEGEIMALDGYGAPFWYDMGNFAATTDGPAMSARLRTFLGPGAGGLTAGGGSGPGPVALGMTAGVVRMPTAAGGTATSRSPRGQCRSAPSSRAASPRPPLRRVRCAPPYRRRARRWPGGRGRCRWGSARAGSRNGRPCWAAWGRGRSAVSRRERRSSASTGAWTSTAGISGRPGSSGW